MSVSLTTTPKQKGDLYLASSLCDGVEDNDLNQVTTLLTTKDADPNVLMPLHGITPFHLVIGNDSEAFAEEVTKLFLRHGGNPNVRSVDGMTPVHVAAAWGRITILELLLANGGNPIALDDDYCSPIHYALQGDHHDAVEVLTDYCMNEDEEDEKPKFKRELDKVLVNNGEVLAEYILTDDSLFDSPVKDSSLTSSMDENSRLNTSDYMPESSATNSMSINNEFVTLRKKRKKTTRSKFDLKTETDEEERLLINKIIAQLSSSIASGVDSSTSILKDCEIEYSPSEATPPKQKRISMTFNRPKRNNECTELGDKSTDRRRSSTLQVIKQHNHVSHLNNHVLKNNLQKASNLSEKNNTQKKTMQSLTKNVTPNKFETSANLSYTNKWLDETIISKSPNLVIGPCPREKRSKLTKTPTYEKRPSPIFAKMSRKSPVVTPTKNTDSSPRNLNGTPISRIPRPKKYFTTPSHLKTVKRSLETPTKTVVPNKRKLHPPQKIVTSQKSSQSLETPTKTVVPNKRKLYPPQKIVTSQKSDNLVPLNQTYSNSEAEENSGASKTQDITCKKKSFRKIAMNLDAYKYDDEDLIGEIKSNAESKSNGRCLSVFDREFKRRLPRSDYVSGIGMLDSERLSRSNSNSRSSSNKENTSQFDLQKTETFIKQGTVETFSEKECVKEKNKEENEISHDFRKSVDAYSSIMCTMGSSSSISSDSYESLSKNDEVAADNAYNTNVGLKSQMSSENNLIFDNDNSNTNPRPDSDTYLSIEEEYKYEDPEEGIIFLERRLCVSPPCASSDMNSSYYSCSTAKSEPLPRELLMLDNVTLRERLRNLGENPGPITETTHRLYLKRLHKLESTGRKPVHQHFASNIQSKKSSSSSIENEVLKSSLISIEWIQNLDDYEANEQKIFLEFHNPNPSRKWREGTTKCSFNYLLLDPRVTEDLPRRAGSLSMSEKWKTFLSAIFYVGKGKQSRPYAHLYDAFKIWVSKKQHVTSKKIQRILDIWNEGRGVVVLHVFHNTIPVEAYTREAAMIEALSTQKLGNCKSGDYYGIVATWGSKEKCELGRYLLFKAFQILLVEGERQIFPDNL